MRHLDANPDYAPGRLFDPGAESLVYIPELNTPVQSLIGAATECGTTPNPFQPIPVYIPTPLVLHSGLHNELGEFEHTTLAE